MAEILLRSNGSLVGVNISEAAMLALKSPLTGITSKSIMARQLLELDTEDGCTILVAVDVPEAAVGRVSAPGELPIQKLDQSFDVVRALIVRGCRPLTKAFEQLHQETQATSAEVEFGISFTAKGNVYLMESSGGATLKVKVSWNMASKQNP